MRQTVFFGKRLLGLFVLLILSRCKLTASQSNCRRVHKEDRVCVGFVSFSLSLSFFSLRFQRGWNGGGSSHFSRSNKCWIETWFSMTQWFFFVFCLFTFDQLSVVNRSPNTSSTVIFYLCRQFWILNHFSSVFVLFLLLLPLPSVLGDVTVFGLTVNVLRPYCVVPKQRGKEFEAHCSFQLK